MDLPLWDPFDDQDYSTSSNSDDVGDVGQCSHCAGYGSDMIEEDALNEKSCMQVLRILIDKADEAIVTLEEDVVMLQCHLAWDDEDWSKPCSAALREKIEHLDILIQNLEREVKEDAHDFSIHLDQPDKLPQRLHDIVKPLLESYFLVKSKQTENSISQETKLTAGGLTEKKSVAEASKSKKKVEVKECINLLETKQTKSLSVEPQEGKINHRQQPSNPLLKHSSASTPIEKASSKERDETGNTDKETLALAEVTRCEPNSRLELQETEIVKPADVILESQIDHVKQMTEASTSGKIQKAGASTPAINKNLHSTLPLVKATGKRTIFPKITLALEAQATEMKDNDPDSLIGLFSRRKIPVRKMKLETIQVKQIHETKSLLMDQTKSIPPLKAETQGPEKKCKAAPEVEKLCRAEEVDMGSSCIGNLKGQQKFGASKNTSRNGEKETQQESSGTKIDGASEVTTISISSPQKKRKLSFQTIRQKKGLRNWLMKLAESDYDTTNITTEDATDNCHMEDMPQNLSACSEDVEKLTLDDLRTIAKNQKLPGYHKL